MLTTIRRGLTVLLAVYATHFELTPVGYACVALILGIYFFMVLSRWNEDYKSDDGYYEE